MGTYRTVVVGTDGSDSSYRAVDRAAEIARDTDAKLILLCAYAPATKRQVESAETELGSDAYQVVGSTPAEETLRTASERAAARGSAVSEAVATQDEPVKALLKAIREHEADLLVVGNRGLNTLAGRILGSVPSDVSRHARCDVLIVHTVR
jgi:nucleotide-binding universal stress UspA family protein